jgi:alkaline phosphatase
LYQVHKIYRLDLWCAGVQGRAMTASMIRLMVAVVVVTGCAQQPRGVVLVIGDGMGAAHATLAGMLRGDRFAIGRMPHAGLVSTRSASSLVTDSAAAATALATGFRTANGYIGVDADGVTRQTVLELAESRRLATGLVTTAQFADATPAAFAAHHPDRKDRRVIAEQMVRSGADVLVSSGAESLGVALPALEDLAAPGRYHPVRTAQQLQAVREGRVLAVLPSGTHDGDSPEAGLPVLAGWALERLADDPDGWFLVIEHEGIDTASHHGVTDAVSSSLRSFDETIAVVLDHAARRGDVLVVVTSDHETGGLQLLGATGEPQLVWTTAGHTGAAVPIFAAGPGAEAFAGSLDSAAVGRALHAVVGEIGQSPRDDRGP